jgi:hypothetical protein
MDVAYLQTQIGRVFTQYINRNYKKTLKRKDVLLLSDTAQNNSFYLSRNIGKRKA